MFKNVSLVLLMLFFMISGVACTVSAEGEVSNYSQCVAAGNRVLRSFPGRCVTKDGKSFIDESAILNQPIIDPPPSALSQQQGTCKNLCGNQVCEAMVCMAVGCPCAESKETCPSDCHE